MAVLELENIYSKKKSLVTFRHLIVFAIVIISGFLTFNTQKNFRNAEGLEFTSVKYLYSTNGSNKEEVVYFKNSVTGEVSNIEANYYSTDSDALVGYAQQDEFYKASNKIGNAFKNRQIIIGTKDNNGINKTYIADVKPMPIIEWPVGFWLSTISGLVCFLIGGWVWALRPRELSSELLALSSLAVMSSALTGGLLMDFPPSITGIEYDRLLKINHIGGPVFGMSIIGLFTIFPRKLISNKLPSLLLLLAIALVILDYLRITPISWVYSSQLVMFSLMVLFICVQTYVVRKTPNDLAALLWVGLSIVIGSSIWLVLAMVLSTHDINGVSAFEFSFASFIIVYFGLALGVCRFGLFQIGDWAFRLFFFSMAAILFVSLDAVFILLMGLSENWALTISILFVAFCYLPLREILWSRFIGGKSMNQNEIFKSVLEIVFSNSEKARQEKWVDFLNQYFEPLEINFIKTDIPKVKIADDGMQLFLPSILNYPAISLHSPKKGRSLFSPNQLRMMEYVMRLLKTASQSRDAYEAGAREERKRIASDLNEDVGARLLKSMEKIQGKARPIINEALDDINSISHEIIGQATNLNVFITDIARECQMRLEAAKINLDWQILRDDSKNWEADNLNFRTISSSIREIFSNIIKHSKARNVKTIIAIQNEKLKITISDDGIGFGDITNNNGQGLSGIKNRIDSINGSFKYYSNQGAIFELEIQINSKDKVD